MQMRWLIVVLIPKGRCNYWGIGLIEPIWKVVDTVMVTHMRSITFHNYLHGSSVTKKGMGTVTIEAKLAQQLGYMEQEPFMWSSWTC